jgi:hypothetical protein
MTMDLQSFTQVSNDSHNFYVNQAEIKKTGLSSFAVQKKEPVIESPAYPSEANASKQTLKLAKDESAKDWAASHQAISATGLQNDKAYGDASPEKASILSNDARKQINNQHSRPQTGNPINSWTIQQPNVQT